MSDAVGAAEPSVGPFSRRRAGVSVGRLGVGCSPSWIVTWLDLLPRRLLRRPRGGLGLTEGVFQHACGRPLLATPPASTLRDGLGLTEGVFQHAFGRPLLATPPASTLRGGLGLTEGVFQHAFGRPLLAASCWGQRRAPRRRVLAIVDRLGAHSGLASRVADGSPRGWRIGSDGRGVPTRLWSALSRDASCFDLAWRIGSDGRSVSARLSSAPPRDAGLDSVRGAGVSPRPKTTACLTRRGGGSLPAGSPVRSDQGTCRDTASTRGQAPGNC